MLFLCKSVNQYLDNLVLFFKWFEEEIRRENIGSKRKYKNTKKIRKIFGQSFQIFGRVVLQIFIYSDINCYNPFFN